MKFRPSAFLKLLALVAIVAVAMPLGVKAAANLVVVKDADSASKAQVDSGKLRVGDGAGPLSVNGSVNVSGGSISPVQDAHLDTINDLTLHSGDTRRPMFSGFGNRRVALTSLIASAEGSNPGNVELMVIAYVRSDTSGDCETLSGFGAAERFTLIVPVGQTVNINWPTPLLWTQYADQNDFYCINVESFGGPTGYTAHVSAYGFTPQAPAPAPTARKAESIGGVPGARR
jgi:hypothetical protein